MLADCSLPADATKIRQPGYKIEHAVDVLVPQNRPQKQPLIEKEVEGIVWVERAKIIYEFVRIPSPKGDKFLKVGEVGLDSFFGDIVYRQFHDLRPLGKQV